MRHTDCTNRKSPFWLFIFLPSGITWEIGDGVIQTRYTHNGLIVMKRRYFDGPAESWLAAARNLARTPFTCRTKSATFRRAEGALA
jgi:hypothetical protein